MTPEEHGLMIGILVRQLQLTKSVLEILYSRGLIEEGDVAAFLALVQSEPQDNAALVDAAHQLYHEAAKHLGVATGLESEDSPES
jgi:hypothetical protein